MSPYKPNKPPAEINGFRVGDHVVTPIGRKAVIIALRCDGYINAEYLGWHSRDGTVILQPNTLRKEADHA